MAKKKTPVLKKPAANRSQGGRSLNIGICSFFALLFESNESSPKKYKLTNEQIEAEVRKEYPDRKGAFFDGKRAGRRDTWGRITVNTYRQKYNKGVFTQGIPPERFSFRYDKRGMRVDSRTGKRLLLPEEIESISLKHQELREKAVRKKL